MAFFNDLGKKLSQAGQATVQKTKELADVAKLNSMISDEEKRINHAYTEIGKLYFEHHANDSEEMFASLIQSIHDANGKIADLKTQAAEIKGVVKCEKCGAEVDKNAAFCGACGNPMPTANTQTAEEQAASSANTQAAGEQMAQTADTQTAEKQTAPAADTQTTEKQMTPAADAQAAREQASTETI